MSTQAIGQSLQRFVARYREHYQQQHRIPPQVNHEENWRSPCEHGEPQADGTIQWMPVAQENSSFDNLEHALEITLHPGIKTFYSTLWLPCLGATAPDGDLDLIGIWNADDFENLQSNIIGHLLQQQRNKLPYTVFFATTIPDSEYCLAVENASGAVVLERAGQKIERVIADNLATFLDTLQPKIPPIA